MLAVRGPLPAGGPTHRSYPSTNSQQRDWGPGMVKCVGPTRCLMRPCSRLTFFTFHTDRNFLEHSDFYTWLTCNIIQMMYRSECDIQI